MSQSNWLIANPKKILKKKKKKNLNLGAIERILLE
jgi:hypothetical protein